MRPILPGRRARGGRSRRRRRRRRLCWPEIAAGRRPGCPARRGRGAGGLALLVAVLVVARAAASGAPAGAAARGPAGPSVPPPSGPAPPAGPTVVHVPPVHAAVVDPFRPPAQPYGPGNRGIEYDTRPGDVVRASASGTVVFAGPVAGALHVTVLHADGVRTSYSFLASVSTAVGARVGAGDALGTAGGRLHFGARLGGTYFDPAALFAGPATVELLPFEIPPGATPEGEARALVELALPDGGLGLADMGPTLRWLGARAGDGMGTLVRAGTVGAGSIGLGWSMASELVDRLAFPRPCSPGPAPSRPAAAGTRVAVTVAGLGSSSDAAAIDDLRTDELGYADDRVVRFSYAGGRTPGTGAGIPGLPAAPYTSPDTQGDVTVAASRLADLVEQVAAAAPGATVDVFAHSLGGVVTRLAVAELVDRGFDTRRLGLVATLAAPHGGADLATAVAAASARPLPDALVEGASALLDLGLDPDAPVVAQLAEGSDVVDSARPVPEGVAFLSVGARGDLVVAAPHTRLEGAVDVTVPVVGVAAHSEIVGSVAATDELARALAGEPPGCEPWHDVLADVVTGHGVSFVEDSLGQALVAVG